MLSDTLDVLSAWNPAPGYVPRAAMTFRSSGTTAQGRSVSAFSGEGVRAYRDAITAGFRAVLKERGFTGTSGISLVPRPEDWPESSLPRCWTGWTMTSPEPAMEM
jgi:hypothetical protein